MGPSRARTPADPRRRPGRGGPRRRGRLPARVRPAHRRRPGRPARRRRSRASATSTATGAATCWWRRRPAQLGRLRHRRRARRCGWPTCAGAGLRHRAGCCRARPGSATSTGTATATSPSATRRADPRDRIAAGRPTSSSARPRRPRSTSASRCRPAAASQIDGARRYEQSGRSVNGAGDLNGDGLSDLVIGAPVRRREHPHQVRRGLRRLRRARPRRRPRPARS